MGADRAPATMVESIAAEWLGDVTTLTDRLIAAIFTDNPEWTDYRPVPREDLWDGCRRYLTRVLEILSGVGPAPAEDDDVAALIGRQRAEQGVPLEVMLRTFRLGGLVVWEALLERAEAAQVEPHALGVAATAMWTVVDGLSSGLSTSYRRTQLEQLRRDDQRRHALIEELLAGRIGDGGRGERVAEQLDLPVGGAYLVVVAGLNADGSAALRSPQTTLGAAHIRSIWHIRVDTLVGLVPLDGHDREFVLARLRTLGPGRAGIATTSRGLAGIATAHQLAALALDTLPMGATGPVAVEDRFPEALLLGSPEIGTLLVETWLGPILALPPRERGVLLATLTAWLEADRSAGRAAQRLYCHRNTVLNRLHHISGLIGRELTGRRAFVELSLALAALDLPAQSFPR